MAKRPVRRPTEEVALARVSKWERQQEDRKLLEDAKRLFELRGRVYDADRK